MHNELRILGHKTVLEWAPADVGMPGNEAVDRFAKHSLLKLGPSEQLLWSFQSYIPFDKKIGISRLYHGTSISNPLSMFLGQHPTI